jgi:hypothetical protein
MSKNVKKIGRHDSGLKQGELIVNDVHAGGV